MELRMCRKSVLCCETNNMLKVVIITSLLLSNLLFGGTSGDCHVPISPSSRSQAEVATIVHILQTCPMWTDFQVSRTPDDVAKQHQIILSMTRIARFPSGVIFISIKHYLAGNRPWDPNPPSKIYLLNRFLFDVPAYTTIDNFPGYASFGSLVGPRPNNGRYDLRWPLRWNAAGQPVISSTGRWNLSGMSGPSVQGYIELTEFEYFRDHYKRRVK